MAVMPVRSVFEIKTGPFYQYCFSVLLLALTRSALGMSAGACSWNVQRHHDRRYDRHRHRLGN